LAPTAIRGASALAGCVRWALLLAQMGKKLAQDTFGETTADKPPGSFVAARVVKKNIGAPEPRFYFGRDEHGLLYRVEPVDQEAGIKDDAHKLAEEVYRREEVGETPLSESKGGRDAFDGWGGTRCKKATEKAIQMGLLESVEKEKGKGKVLKSRKSQEQRDFGMFNYE